jgi:hypothetical protein
MAQALSRPEPVEPPLRPRLAGRPSRFILLEREVEQEYRPRMLRVPATQGRHGGCGGPRHDAGVPRLRPTDELSRYPFCFLAGALGTPAGLSVPLSLLALQTGTPALIGSAERGTRAHLWLVGSSFGIAGRGGAIRTGGTAGTVAARGHHQRDGRMASHTAIGTGGGRLQRGPESISR